MARAVERTYLSIGDVLHLIQDEFPETTISKIRFLEREGLLDPERTPSGYRKFYPADLARLRWVLTQQRDHFLPLKVIKDRLAAGFVPPEEHPGNSIVSAAQDAALDEPPPEVETASSNASSNGSAEVLTASTPDDELVGDPVVGDPVVGDPVGGDPVGGEVARPEAMAPVRGLFSVGPPDEDVAAHPVDDIADHGRADADPADPTADVVGRGSVQSEALDLTGVSLTRKELAAAGGMDDAGLAELERFGLVSGERIGSETLYGDDALLIVRHAARLAEYGIEARHLRQYRTGVDREVSLLSQVVSPLLRQRGGSGQRHAAATLAELLELGEGLRHALVRQAVHDYLGGS